LRHFSSVTTRGTPGYQWVRLDKTKTKFLYRDFADIKKWNKSSLKSLPCGILISLATIGSWIYLEGYQGEDEDKAAQKIKKNWGFEPFFTQRGNIE